MVEAIQNPSQEEEAKALQLTDPSKGVENEGEAAKKKKKRNKKKKGGAAANQEQELGL